MVPYLFDRHEFHLCAEGALYWPARRALLIADLHLEKASFFARFGQHLPPYDSLATLDALTRLVERTGAQAIWCLGDSFHDAGGGTRLSGAAFDALQSLSARTDWLWITGNHDVDGSFPVGRVMREADVDGVLLRHEASPHETRPEISGHFHPKWTVRRRGVRVSRRCFVRGGNKLILPAFGALTGGLDAGHEAVRAALGRDEDAAALIPTHDQILHFPLGEIPQRRRA
ncbi:ligase-associated DNA damage response endonuclease PdeM [Sphingobium subterraneum]|uniref:Calcineurin-like phosphoesterase domain-containing protein n=1 Tax=Sphingobium subterraneum TaxID=627688 RepID=A0A841J1L9_9SPHN|nr:ligase-associated DNA damage response endonuclease PdeM [Sphingobium subterraneum]MBB6124242.1 hypothetical protein [Sphingobium subterraneum]